MTRFAPALFLPLALAACGSSAGNEAAGASKGAGNRTAASAPTTSGGSAATPQAPAAGGPVRLQAGLWEVTGQIRTLETPGVPPQEQAGLRQQMGRTMTNRICMTEAQARDFARFSTPRSQGSGCSIGPQVYADGILRYSVSCPMPGGRGGTVRMNAEGRYTPTTLALEMRQEMPNPGRGGGQIRMSSTLSARRVGVCPPGGAPAQQPIRVRPSPNTAPAPR